MKNLFILTAILFSIGMNISCDDQIYPELQNSAPFLIVDAWINDKPDPQIIRLASSVPYFDQEIPQINYCLQQEVEKYYRLTFFQNPLKFKII